MNNRLTSLDDPLVVLLIERATLAGAYRELNRKTPHGGFVKLISKYHAETTELAIQVARRGEGPDAACS